MSNRQFPCGHAAQLKEFNSVDKVKSCQLAWEPKPALCYCLIYERRCCPQLLAALTVLTSSHCPPPSCKHWKNTGFERQIFLIQPSVADPFPATDSVHQNAPIVCPLLSLDVVYTKSWEQYSLCDNYLAAHLETAISSKIPRKTWRLLVMKACFLNELFMEAKTFPSSLYRLV